MLAVCMNHLSHGTAHKYTVFTRVICVLFSSLAAEKFGCVKYVDFAAFGPRNAVLSLFAFFNNYFCFLQ
jgi:hypothetical protein